MFILTHLKETKIKLQRSAASSPFLSSPPQQDLLRWGVLERSLLLAVTGSLSELEKFNIFSLRSEMCFFGGCETNKPLRCLFTSEGWAGQARGTDNLRTRLCCCSRVEHGVLLQGSLGPSEGCCVRWWPPSVLGQGRDLQALLSWPVTQTWMHPCSILLSLNCHLAIPKAQLCKKGQCLSPWHPWDLDGARPREEGSRSLTHRDTLFLDLLAVPLVTEGFTLTAVRG